MTGCAKNVPDHTACQDIYYDLYLTSPSCRVFHNRLTIFAPFYATTFATNPRVVGSVKVDTHH